MRIHHRVAELRRDALGQLVGQHVLEQLGLLVHEVPRHVEHLHQQQLEQAVVAQRAQRHAPPLGGQAHAAVALVLEQPELVEPAQHPGDGAGREAEPLGQRVRGDRALEPGFERVHGLEVVLDGAGRRRSVHEGQPSREPGLGLPKPACHHGKSRVRSAHDRRRPRPRPGRLAARGDSRARARARDAGAARAGVRGRRGLHRPGQLRDQHRRRREVRLPARVGDRRGEPDGDARPVPVGQGRHRDGAEPARAVPGAPSAARDVGPVGAGRDRRDRHRPGRVRRRGDRAEPALRRPAVRGRPDHRGRRVRDPRPAAARLPPLRARDRRLPR